MPVLNRHIRAGDSTAITKERESATFDPYGLSCVLYGEEIVKERRSISKAVAASSEFANTIDMNYATREQKIENAARKAQAFIEKKDQIVPAGDPYCNYEDEVFGFDGMPLGLHSAMFLPALRTQADDELAAEFIPRAERYEIIGTYAQTEMGHGTNLRALGTTATYDARTHEFVLHTPTVTDTKWWPGNLGKMANYAVVVAQLLIEGKRFGPHTFLVQLRDEETHLPMKGITIGDIGPKMAFNTTDNGFLAFDHYRIPRKMMLMRHAKVDADGSYTAPPHAKLGYSAMVYVRAHMAGVHGKFLGLAATIATRLAATSEFSHGTVQSLDDTGLQSRLLPQIAKAYAYLLTGKEVLRMYDKSLEEIARGQTDSLADLHALTSGLKSVITFEVGRGIEQCRAACGPYGLETASGFPIIYGNQIAGCTYEGENMVMLLQSARYLVKSVSRAQKGQTLSDSVAYLSTAEKSARSSIGEESGLEAVFEAVQHASRRLATEAAEFYRSAIDSGLSEERAWNACAVEMTRAARIHTRLFIMEAFSRRVLSLPRGPVRDALEDLLSLFAHGEAVDMAAHLLEDTFCSGDQIRMLRARLNECLVKVRPNALSFMDAFEFSDRELNSPLGRRDGNFFSSQTETSRKQTVSRPIPHSPDSYRPNPYLRFQCKL